MAERAAKRGLVVLGEDVSADVQQLDRVGAQVLGEFLQLLRDSPYTRVRVDQSESVRALRCESGQCRAGGGHRPRVARYCVGGGCEGLEAVLCLFAASSSRTRERLSNWSPRTSRDDERQTEVAAGPDALVRTERKTAREDGNGSSGTGVTQTFCLQTVGGWGGDAHRGCREVQERRRRTTVVALVAVLRCCTAAAPHGPQPQTARHDAGSAERPGARVPRAPATGLSRAVWTNRRRAAGMPGVTPTLASGVRSTGRLGFVACRRCARGALGACAEGSASVPRRSVWDGRVRRVSRRGGPTSCWDARSPCRSPSPSS